MAVDFPDRTSLRVIRDLGIPVDRVWEAFVDPEHLGRWLWADHARNVTTEADVRTGGHYRCYTDAPDGDHDWPSDRWGVRGTYLEVIDRARLIYTLHWDAPVGYNESGDEVPDELVQVMFNEHPHGTRVTMIHGGLPDDGESARAHARGVEAMLDQLESILSG